MQLAFNFNHSASKQLVRNPPNDVLHLALVRLLDLHPADVLARFGVAAHDQLAGFRVEQSAFEVRLREYLLPRRGLRILQRLLHTPQLEAKVRVAQLLEQADDLLAAAELAMVQENFSDQKEGTDLDGLIADGFCKL